MYKCKQCEFVSNTKEDFWSHQRVHIKVERLLECPKCPFVTEYKHHLEYHLRNHMGSKPFKCTLCDYQCVNQSMLRSHVKSHTKSMQYQCANCSYSSKYFTSLKSHMDKFNHQASSLIISDTHLQSSSNSSISSESLTSPPLKQQFEKSPKKFEVHNTHQEQEIEKNDAYDDGLLSSTLPYTAHFPYLAAAAALVATTHQQHYPNHLMDDNAIAAATVATLLSNFTNETKTLTNNKSTINNLDQNTTKSLFQCEKCKFKTTSKKELKRHQRSDHFKNTKIESTKLKTQVTHTQQHAQIPFNEVKLITNQENSATTPTTTTTPSTLSLMHECNYCNILFKDLNLFSLHKQFHGDSTPYDAFKCTQCGIRFDNKYDFNLHIAKQSHLNINSCNN